MEKKGNTVTIYYLKESSSYDIFYIGRTKRPLHKRLSQHLNRAKQNCSLPISIRIRQSDYQIDISPIVTIFGDTSQGEIIEMMYISLYSKRGMKLTNTVRLNDHGRKISTRL